MPFTLTMPKLSPTMESGTITKWCKKVGDHVKAGDVLFEVATDKATVEHNAIDAGFLRKILIEEGQDAIVNQAVAVFTEKADESIEGYKPEGMVPVAASDEQPATVNAAVKSTVEPAVRAVTGGFQQPAFVAEPPLESYHFPESGDMVYGRMPASPLARKLAKEKGIDLTTVKGSGPNKRIMARDIDLGQPDAVVAFGRTETPEIAPGTYELQPLSPMRKLIAQRLQESKTFIPHFYVSQDIRCDALHAVREQLKQCGIKVSFNDLVIRAVALALREHPDVNSGFDSVKQAIIAFKTIDISVAVSVQGGLITPIVRHADFKNIGDISAEVKVLAAKAKTGKLERQEYVGGSFTISNMGMYGISDFAAIINPPQAAILAVAGIEERPVVDGGSIVIGKVMRLTLSVDHRVIDGALGAQFLKTLQKFLENPAVLLV
ncbi:MAG: pyruvate dehydrogenase complex dihydrolipoamide acetyltransferase [Simkania sp.]|nr:pyruvate dehydrogenase complex dihydrolipoamide acetyltransferase [Simkania sp.]